ncbi:MAG: DNA polymerase III subunit delta [bacterium]
MKPSAKPIYLFWGEDEFLVGKHARSQVDDLMPADDQAFGLEIIEGMVSSGDEAAKSLKQALEAVQTRGFLGDGKVVWLRGVNFLGGEPIGKGDAVKTGIEHLIEWVEAADGKMNPLVISSGKLDRRSRFYKVCEARGAALAFNPPALSKEAAMDLTTRARTLLEQAGVAADAAVVQLLVARTGTDTRQMASEIDKLALYVGDAKRATLDDVRAIVGLAREAPAWDLSDAVGQKDLPRAIALERQLLYQKESPIRLIGMLVRHLRELSLVREALDQGWLLVQGNGYHETAAWSGLPVDVEQSITLAWGRNPRAMHPFRLLQIARQARKFTALELQTKHQQAVAAHEKLVSSSLPAPLVLELLLVRLAR